MVEAGRAAGNVDASVSYLAAAANSGFGGSSYVAAIAAHALTTSCVKVNKGCDEAKRARQKMLDAGVSDEEGTMRWGAASAKTTTTTTTIPGGGRGGHGHGSSTEVEGTAYAVLALVRGGDAGGVSRAYAGARHLLLQRTARGGFRSTQDTVVALEALGAYAGATYSREVSVSVNPQLPASVVAAKDPGIITVNNGNFDLLQQVDVSPATEMSAIVTGTGTALLQLGVSYNLVEDPTPPEYDITVTARATKTAPGARRRRRGRSLSAAAAAAASVAADDARSLEVQACVRRRGGGEGAALGMSLLEIGLFTGFAPDATSLEQLRVKGAGLINRVDVDDRKVIVYMEEIGASTTCVTFQAAQEHEVKNLKPAPSTVASYYHPDAKGSAITDTAALAQSSGESAGRGGEVTVDGNVHVPGTGNSPPSTVVNSEAPAGEHRRFWMSFLLTLVFALAANGF